MLFVKLELQRLDLAILLLFERLKLVFTSLNLLGYGRLNRLVGCGEFSFELDLLALDLCLVETLQLLSIHAVFIALFLEALLRHSELLLERIETVASALQLKCGLLQLALLIAQILLEVEDARRVLLAHGRLHRLL